MNIIHFIAMCCLLALAKVATAEQSYADTSKGKVFIDSIAGKYGYSRGDLVDIFSHVYKDEDILKKISKPAEKTIRWHRYRNIFLDEKRIINGAHFYQTHKEVLEQAYVKYGISPFIIVAILGVETRYGKVMGDDQVIKALATIGFDYPKREQFFTKELREFLQMCKENNFDPLTLKGSYAGAMGMAQFMPSSYRHYAVDYENDGIIDLWNNPNDAIFSIANYLAENGWHRDGPIADAAQVLIPYHGMYNHKPFTTLGAIKAQGVMPTNSVTIDSTPVGVLSLDGKSETITFITFNNFKVITTYNTSPLYAMAVYDLAQAIEKRVL